jgi:hypothetical protein
MRCHVVMKMNLFANTLNMSKIENRLTKFINLVD